jgi:glycosyltransferase involved in cell wall biosynthesis
MKILSVHNSYRNPGGEDHVFEQEAQLLRSRQHRVIQYRANNDEVTGHNPLVTLGNTVWNRHKYRELSTILKNEKPDLMHVHNTFSAISPAVYYAAREEGVPVVQTLHNYRLLCPSATLFRAGHICEDCLGRQIPLPGMLRGCYRDSKSATAAGGFMLAAHNLMGTWQKTVTAFIALSESSRDKFIQGGYPGEKILVKPNFLTRDPGMGGGGGNYALYVGRLAEEKGIRVLLEAWKKIGKTLPLLIAGNGPLAAEVEQASREIDGVTWLQWLPREQVTETMKKASVLVSPTVWYEPFGLNIAEAFATGLPVIASKLGSMTTMVEHLRTGLHITPGSADSLVDAVHWWVAHQDEAGRMRVNARLEYESKYTAEKNYSRIMSIYELTLSFAASAMVAHLPQEGVA